MARRKPTSPGQRFKSVLDFSMLTVHKPEKSLVTSHPQTGARNNHGHITSRFRGGGAKRAFRIIDFTRDKHGVPGRVKTIEYDPNRSAYIALVFYADGEKRYILAPDKLKVDQVILSGEKIEPDMGNSLLLRDIPLGMQIHNVELRPGGGAKLVRAAGAAATLTAKEGKYAHVTLPSGEVRMIHLNCKATMGQVSNLDHKLEKLGKAGISRHLGRRPHNRGTSQNPVDHPMGGGEGRTHGGRHPCSPWGKLSKGGKTRRRRNTSSNFIVRRRKK
ncbi:MAG: 50S ribosomal protein L2 [Planctomycetota bacterium]